MELRELARATIIAAAAANARKRRNANLFVKVLLVIGAGAATVAQLVDAIQSIGQISPWTIVGLVGAVCVGIGGIYVLLTEQDTSLALQAATDVIEEAGTNQDKIARSHLRALEMYNFLRVMDNVILQSIGVPGLSLERILTICLQAAQGSLVVALDFNIKGTWAIYIYAKRRASEPDKWVLRCVAQIRSISGKAMREFPEGVGVVGVAHLTGDEVVVPDISDPTFHSLFNQERNAASDTAHYKSMIAIPILVGNEQESWGVAVATSDVAGHFSVVGSDGMQTSEPMRALATIVALVVSIFGDESTKALS